MAYRKAKTITFKLPVTATLVDVKSCIEKEDKSAEINVTQDVGRGQYLVELGSQSQAEAFIDSGMDFRKIHVECRPPSGYYINVSVIGLKAYVTEDAVIQTAFNFINRIKYD